MVSVCEQLWHSYAPDFNDATDADANGMYLMPMLFSSFSSMEQAGREGPALVGRSPNFIKFKPALTKELMVILPHLTFCCCNLYCDHCGSLSSASIEMRLGPVMFAPFETPNIAFFES